MRRCPKPQEGEIQEPFSSRLTWIFPTGKKISPFPHENKKKIQFFLLRLQCPHPTAQPLSPGPHPALHTIWDISSSVLPTSFPFPMDFFPGFGKKNEANAGEPWLVLTRHLGGGFLSGGGKQQNSGEASAARPRLLPCPGDSPHPDPTEKGRASGSKGAAPGCGANK